MLAFNTMTFAGTILLFTIPPSCLSSTKLSISLFNSAVILIKRCANWHQLYKHQEGDWRLPINILLFVNFSRIFSKPNKLSSQVHAQLLRGLIYIEVCNSILDHVTRTPRYLDHHCLDGQQNKRHPGEECLIWSVACVIVPPQILRQGWLEQSGRPHLRGHERDWVVAA